MISGFIMMLILDELQHGHGSHKHHTRSGVDLPTALPRLARPQMSYRMYTLTFCGPANA